MSRLFCRASLRAARGATLFAVVVLGWGTLASPAWALDPKKVEITTNDQMRYDTTDVSVKVGQPLTIVLSSEGSQAKSVMAHNLVILQLGTNVDEYDALAAKHPAENYLPTELPGKALAATKLLGPGETSTITWTPKVPGVYDFICTYPGHLAAGMRGTITVE